MKLSLAVQADELVAVGREKQAVHHRAFAGKGDQLLLRAQIPQLHGFIAATRRSQSLPVRRNIQRVDGTKVSFERADFPEGCYVPQLRRAFLTAGRQSAPIGCERGTDHHPVRCAALTGTLGQRVACAIYEWRPAPCREFAALSHACTRARARHGLPALPGACD